MGSPLENATSPTSQTESEEIVGMSSVGDATSVVRHRAESRSAGHPRDVSRPQNESPPRRWDPRGGESGAFAWAAPPWWIGKIRERRPSWLPNRARGDAIGDWALRTPCAPKRCKKDPSTRQPSRNLSLPKSVCLRTSTNGVTSPVFELFGCVGARQSSATATATPVRKDRS